MYKVTICGSFHRHMNQFHDAIHEFEENGCEVLSPRSAKIVDEKGEFLFVESDPYRSIVLVENRHLKSIDASDFIWLTVPDGYVGQSASLELGYAIARNKHIFCERIPSDMTLAEYVTICRSPIHAIDMYTHLPKHITSDFNIILDPHEAAQEAHYLIDKLTALLIQPGILLPSELEKEVATYTKQLVTIFNIHVNKK